MSSRRQPGLGQRVIEVARAIDAVDVVELVGLLVAEARVDDHRPRAAHDERTHRERMRLRSSGGACFAHSGFGTTPNIAPPSRRKKPSQSEISSRSPSE